MNKQYAQITSYNERWQRRNFSRAMAAVLGVFAGLIFVLGR